MVTRIKNTSRPVGCKTILHLHFILSEAAHVSLVKSLHSARQLNALDSATRDSMWLKFSSVYRIVHIYFIDCFIAKLYQETLLVASTVRFMASAVLMWPICYSETLFNFHPWEIQQNECQVVAYRTLKTIDNIKQSSLKVIAYERWSLTRGSIYSDLTWKLFVIWKSDR